MRNVEDNAIVRGLKRDYNMMMDVLEKFERTDGFRLVKDDKKKNLKMYLAKQEGSRVLTIKFECDRINIPIFNLLTLINEVELYDLWFPFCKNS